MSVTVERPGAVSGLDWTVFRGERIDVMRALGDEHSDAIMAWRALVGGSWSGLIEYADGFAAQRFDAIVASSKRLLPTESAELAALADGAGIPERDLWVLNLRGDLGRDGTGCSDLAGLAADGGVLLGHNEDGDAEVRELIRLITLDIDGDPCVTVLWYPGMLPANSFVTTSAGLSFGMDHLPTAVPNLGGAGRHLVARHAQRQTDGAAARAALTDVPCAGAFAFNMIDEPGGRADVIENVSGRVAAARAETAAIPLRHVNHPCLVPDGTRGIPDDDRWLAESRGRGALLEAGSVRAATAADVMSALRAPGVLNTEEHLYTYATTVVDTARGRVLVRGHGDEWEGDLAAFARGRRAAPVVTA
ncbi:hypothetical protein M2359_002043 [Gordonia amarae]|nr:C45 family peptidase [Gordonia amarae]MCS3878414.1 hypothetical protein [Gordonia amarae]